MRRLFGVLLAAAIVTLPALSPRSGAVHAQAAAPAQKLTLDGDAVLWMLTVKPDKTADFESVLAVLKDALAKSTEPDAKAQAAGWKVVKVSKPQPDGTIVYAFLIDPVVRGADYSVMQNIYTAVTNPEERNAIYAKYTGAVVATLMRPSFENVLDLSK